MIRVSIDMQTPPKLVRLLSELRFDSRRQVLSVGANAMRILVIEHIRREATKRHATAHRLGAQPTRLFEKGAARVTSHSTDDTAEVLIPIVGMARAFHDVTITPVHAKALTLPAHAASYGHRAAELVRMGWQIFRPKGKGVLMGKQKDQNGEPVLLYVLKKRVTQRQDRSLLPSDRDLVGTATSAISKYIASIIKRAA